MDGPARMLSARLEAVASAAERSGASAEAVGRLLESAAVASVRAVALELLAGRTTRAPAELREAA
jgi:hypothetical protein